MEGRVFKIERYSLHNGPGTRTTIFLKGCPLRCAWCANPESQRSSDELMYNPERCLRECDECVKLCPIDALHKDRLKKIVIDRSLCTLCGKCGPACPTPALSQTGMSMSVEEALRELCRDRAFYDSSGGGVTLSGGEPLSQPAFVLELLKACKKHALHTVLDTSGYGRWSDLEAMLEYTDLILYDLKCIDAEKHQRYTGVDNETILSNLTHIARDTNATVIIRFPWLPGINDSERDLDRLCHLLEQFSLRRLHILPYHRLGKHKYTMLGETYSLETISVPSKERADALKTTMLTKGFIAEVIG